VPRSVERGVLVEAVWVGGLANHDEDGI
jgi:hypothetical protein